MRHRPAARRSPTVLASLLFLAPPALAALAALAAPSPADARPLAWCAAAAPSPPSEARRIEALLDSIGYVSERLDAAVRVHDRAAPMARAGVRPFPLGERGEAGRLALQLYDLTVGHWLEIKTALCRCLPEAERAATACARLEDERAHACRVKPRRLHGIDVECLVRGR